MTLKKHYIPFDMIQYVEINHSPFQKRKNKCTMIVSIYSENKRSVKIKQLPRKAAIELLNSRNIAVIGAVGGTFP